MIWGKQCVYKNLLYGKQAQCAILALQAANFGGKTNKNHTYIITGATNFIDIVIFVFLDQKYLHTHIRIHITLR